MSSSFSSTVDSDASGPAGGIHSIIYKSKPKHGYPDSHGSQEAIFPKGMKRQSSRRTARSPSPRDPPENSAGAGDRRPPPAPSPEEGSLPAGHNGLGTRAAPGPSPGPGARPGGHCCPRPTPPWPPGFGPRSSAPGPSPRHPLSLQHTRPSPRLTSDPGSPISATARLPAPTLRSRGRLPRLAGRQPRAAVTRSRVTAEPPTTPPLPTPRA